MMSVSHLLKSNTILIDEGDGSIDSFLEDNESVDPSH